MTEDKWFRIINDKMEDIPARVKKMKSKYWKINSVFIGLIILGTIITGNCQDTISCFLAIVLAVTGIAGIMAVATMCHSQLCLYRTIMEIRKQEDKK
ncbi:MAG: hypothetical protein JW983_06340 [Elusimicrobia bacterium]|nr:hypothetical protein [Elusimicrobiota bacterium]